MKRVCIFIGGRANWGRLKSVIELLEPHCKLEIIQGTYKVPEYQHLVVFSIDGMMYADNENATVFTCSMVAQHVSNYFNGNNGLPDLAILHGDRFENLGFAIAAAYNHIPMAHTEGGEVSGNIDDKVRRAISALADVHFPVTEKAADTLKRSGYSNVHTVGSPALDGLKEFSDEMDDRFILALYHPCQEDDNTKFIKAMNIISTSVKVVWVNPNIDPGHRHLLKKIHRLNIDVVKNLTPAMYHTYLNSCLCLVGNTSSGIKEGAFLGVPYVLVGDRQKGRETCVNVIRTKCEVGEIVNSVLLFTEGKMRYLKSRKFGRGDSSESVVKILKENNYI